MALVFNVIFYSRMQSRFTGMSENNEHPNHPSVDQSDRTVPRNLRQTGDPNIEMLVSTRVRKSPFFDKSFNEEGAWRCTVYNRLYHPRGLVEPEDGGVLNDPVLLRPEEDEFWFSISDSTLMQWIQGVNVDNDFDVEIDEIDVAPMQIQGPLSEDVMVDVVGDEVSEIPYYGLMSAEINGCDVLISQTGFSGEAGFEIYVEDAQENAEKVWDPVMETVKDHGGRQIAPGHHRRIAAGIMSWGQDLDHETSPFQVNLGYHVPDDKDADYIGKEALEEQKEQIENGEYPFTHKLIGLKMAGEPIRDYAPDFWLISDPETGEECGYLTSPWWNPDLETNIGMGFVPAEKIQEVTDTPLNDDIYDEELDLEFQVHLPDEYSEEPGEPTFATAATVPFKESVNPSAREQAKLNARKEAEANSSDD